MRAIISMAAFCLVIASPAKAIRPDECEQQRAAFPKEWNDVSKEKPRFFCWSHYSGALKVTLGAGDKVLIASAGVVGAPTIWFANTL